MTEQYEKFYEEKKKYLEERQQKREENEGKWSELRASYLGKEKLFAPIQKGILFRKTLCPICGGNLDEVQIKKGWKIPNANLTGFVGFLGKSILSCKDCDYVYAYEEGDSFNTT